MSFHAGRGCPRGRPAAPGPMYQPAPPRYQYDTPAAPSPIYNPQGGSGYMPPHPDFMPFHFPAPSHGSNALPQCPIRPPVFPELPPFPPLAPHNSDSSVPVQSSYPYMMPTITPPPLPPVPHSVPSSMPYPPSYPMSYPPQPQLPPPPSFNPAYVQPGGSFKPERSRPPLQYKADSCSRSPERLRHHDDHRHSGHSYGGYGGRHNREFGEEKRDRGCSSERRRSDSPRYKVDYDRGRVPSRHRSRERYRHREEPGSSPSDRHRKHIRNRSGSRERKRRRVEEEKGRRTDSASSSRERSVNYSRSRDAEETSTDRHEEEKGEDELLKPAWIRCTHAENYYSNDPMDQVGDSTVVGTSKLRDLYERFEEELGRRQVRAKSSRPKWEPPKTKLDQDQDESSSESECDSDGGGSSCSSSSDSAVFDVIAEIKRKKAHPDRLHEELWYNDAGQMNDGPLCKCSAKARRTGIRHSIYPGEQPVKACRPMSNNAGKLFHYRITVSPPTNFLTDRPTVIEYDDHEYLFEGFSCFSHTPLTNIPLCRVIRFNIDYTIHFIEEMAPENYCIKGLELFSSYLFKDILELYDWNLTGPEDNGQSGCQRFHFMPRFVRFLPDGGKEVLSMHQVLLYLLRSSTALVPEEEIANMLQWEELEWQKYAEECKGMIVTNPGMKPSSVRIDQLDREQFNSSVITFPIIVHFGIRPAQLSYAGDPQYQKLWKSYVKLRHLLANSPKVKQIEKQKLTQREEALQKIRQKNTMRREVTVELSSQGFWKSGIRSDVCQHAMMLPVLTHHIRYHQCLMHLDKLIGYMFKERCLLQLAMTHPSHHLNFGMNPDHARNSLSNCGIRQPKYGDRKVHHMYMRKKGINTLINIMSRLGQDDPSPSRINHNERLEFLGDAVVEFLTSVHLYYLFPNLEEGGLATYRTAIVQNQHLAMLAKKLELDRFMLYAHGPDLCRESDLRHAMANCFEALIGAVYLEGGLEEAKQLFGRLLFNSEELRDVWLNYPPHPLQVQEPLTDRQLIESSPVLQKLTNFEDAIGVLFTHARLLARAFTLRTVGFNHLTLGHNQRMEFLGDSIMQLVATEYLFIHFPDHHEGHLTLLRSSLVNNRTQAKVAEELGMQEYAITNDKTKRPVALRTKTLADLLESFIAALYIDKDLEFVHTFMNVCFFPRLKEFILNQDWNDPKSQLQQCCLTLRTEGKEPDIPLYKTLQTVGPSHARTYTVAVYFKGERIGCGKGPSIQQAEMGAAMDALEKYNFPQMAHQKRFIERKYRQELKEMRRERERQERDSDEG
ncbi:ribonuclease 3-like isoform X1 [Sinocyclocheilus grahami]|nr:PREDICTED: ribonuclease 3-like isoform X1 [Sinocyclocheilus grahami]XP_016095449.1 PREDICTED: ribonuclease 3-like isoform X1 [Sinocyclocheilus grahami]XP_016095450.1 PREDICTED: ribonuclease 3-like isoform X1 [Sinocyclocheilus grahami]